jgi:threonine dehydrogenase-like Zn-dependent dehydrogenase
MKAVAVKPGETYSAHLVDIDEPKVASHEVLVEVEAIGIDGTDREINQGGYGKPPKGEDVLVMGHESYTRVLEVGDAVRRFKPGDHVTSTVRRPGGCINCRHGAHDMCLDGDDTEHGAVQSAVARPAGFDHHREGARNRQLRPGDCHHQGCG